MCLTEAVNFLKSDTQENRKSETRTITLNYGENLDESVFRFQKGLTFLKYNLSNMNGVFNMFMLK